MTGLSPEILRALAPAPGFKRVDRFLPDPYRRALHDPRTPMAVVTKASRDTLKRADFDLEQLQRSRAVEYFTDLSDGAALGALHEQTPWPEEDTESFRTRLRMVSVLALQGAASARRMLALIGLACSADLLAAFSYRPDDPTYSHTHNGQTQAGSIELGQTLGLFAKPDGGSLFAADVLDAPLRLYTQTATPLSRPEYVFELQNPAFKTLSGVLGDAERLYPDPVFDFEAEQPIGPFALIQVDPSRLTHAPRVIAVNRKMRAGERLTVDVAAMRWDHSDSPTPTSLGWITSAGDKAALYAGLSEIASFQSLFDNEPGDPAAGYALDVRGAAQLDWTGRLVDEMVNKGAIPQGSGTALQMPALLGDGKTRWHVIEIGKPANSGRTDILEARFSPLPRTAKLRITARWAGRRAGEFALRFDETELALDQSGPLAHRSHWLDTMINRFKLAGTIRVTPLPEDAFAELPLPEVELELSSKTALTDGFDLDTGPQFDSHALLADDLTVYQPINLNLHSDISANAAFDLALAPPDGSLTSHATALDALTIHPQATLGLGKPDRAIATDTVEISAGGPVLPLNDHIVPTASFTLSPQQKFELASRTKLADALEITPVADPVTPPDPPPNLPSVTLDLKTHVRSGDTVTIRKTNTD